MAQIPGTANQVSRHLIALAGGIRSRVAQELLDRGHTLSPGSTQVIPNLPVDGRGMSELAAALRLTLQRTGQLVQKLEEDGYVARVADPTDGRAKRVIYTPRGLDLVHDIDAVMADLTGGFERVLGKGSFQDLCTSLERLDHAFHGEGAPLRLRVPG